MIKFLTGLLMILVLHTSYAEEFMNPEDIPPDAVVATSTRGIIESIDLVERTALISGYTYDFGPVDMRIPVEVKMLKSDYGAFELLQPGMKVEIVYGDTGDQRLVVRVQQLSDSTVLEDA